MEGNYEAALDAGKRAVELNPYDMGARGVLGICHLVIGEHRQAIELFYTEVSAAFQPLAAFCLTQRRTYEPLLQRAQQLQETFAGLNSRIG